VRTDLDQVVFRRVEPVPAGAPAGVQVWDLVAPDGSGVFARAEVFPGQTQWGVRLGDRAPALTDEDLVKLVARLLVWEVGCRADTVDIVLSRTHEHHTLVRVGADYV
jgi:hypothetical protein